MRKVKIVPREYYHLYNRGNNKQKIFLDERDWIRFLFLILYFQSPETLTNLSRPVTSFVRSRAFNILENKRMGIVEKRNVELVCFTLMPNHFHLLVQEIKTGGISQYMQRILTAYAKYFNAKYKKSGHLFQGPFQIVHIQNNEQLLHLSAYIHRNPREIKKWKNQECQYPWSSYQDCVRENRWGDLLRPQIVTDQFASAEDYKNFVKTSSAKLTLEEKYLIDY